MKVNINKKMKQFKPIAYTVLVIFFISFVGGSYESLKEEINNLGQDLELENSPSQTDKPATASEEIDKYIYALDGSDKKTSKIIGDEEIYELGDTKDNNINQRSLIYIQRSKKIPVRLDIIRTGDAVRRNQYNDIWTYTKLLNTFFKQHLLTTPFYSSKADHEQAPVTLKTVNVQYTTDKQIPFQPVDNKIEHEKKNMHVIIDKFNNALNEFNTLHETSNNPHEWPGSHDTKWKTNENFPNSFIHSGERRMDDSINANPFLGATLDTPDTHKHTPSKWNPARAKYVSKNIATATVTPFESGESINKAEILNAYPQYAARANVTTPRIRMKPKPWAVFSDEFGLKKSANNNMVSAARVNLMKDNHVTSVSPGFMKDPFYNLKKPIHYMSSPASSSSYQYSPSVESGKHRNFYAIDNLNGAGYASDYTLTSSRSKDHYKSAQYIFNKRDDLVKQPALRKKEDPISLSMWSDYIDSIIGPSEGGEH